jgi:hypothetical protein
VCSSDLTWIGFVSDANGPAVTYLDNVRLRSGRTEAAARGATDGKGSKR